MRVPLVIRGHEIGALAFRPGGRQAWSDADRDLAEKAATQVALALENNRLLEETRQRAFLEQRVSEISDRFSRSIDLDSLLQTAVRELAALPDVTDASVFVGPGLTTGRAGDLD
jgi:GAF domain-containing protein